MSCKVCASDQLLECPAELSFTFPGLKRVNVPAVYVCDDVLVCTNCGYAELVIPASKLEQLKQGMGESPSGNGRRYESISELFGFGGAETRNASKGSCRYF